jgi:uncharacterized protein YgiM (DUF1202 family)
MPQVNKETMMKNFLTLFLLVTPVYCFADFVVPIDKVENSINIRLSPDASTDIVGKLKQGESIELVAGIDGWYEVQLEGDATGYVSADWSRVVTAEELAEKDAVAVSELEGVAEQVAVELVEELVEQAETQVVEEPAAQAAAEVVVEAAAVETVVEEVAEELVEVEEEVVDAAAVETLVEEVTEEVAIVEEEIVESQPVVEEADVVVEEVVEIREEVELELELKGTKNLVAKFRDKTELGNSQIYDDGNQVGIGTTSPKQRLEVNGSIQIHEQNSSVAGLMITQSSGDTGYIMHNRASTLTIGAGSVDRITVDRDGNVGIGVSRPSHPLEMSSGAHVTTGGVWTNSSSREKKENIEILQADVATSAVMSLQPVLFNYRNEVGEEYVGFIAEDVPDLVAVGDRDALSSMDIVAVLTRVVQEQQRKIRELEERLDAM